MFLMGGVILFSTVRPSEKFAACGLFLYLILNCIYLIKCPPPNSEKSRLVRMIGLWFDAKERELQERGKAR
jgi:hypothetical protein